MGSKVGVIIVASIKANIMAVFRLSESHLGVITPTLDREVVITGISRTRPIANNSLDTIEIELPILI